MWLGVLFIVQFNYFARTTGFYWSYIHALTQAARSYALLNVATKSARKSLFLLFYLPPSSPPNSRSTYKCLPWLGTATSTIICYVKRNILGFRHIHVHVQNHRILSSRIHIFINPMSALVVDKTTTLTFRVLSSWNSRTMKCLLKRNPSANLIHQCQESLRTHREIL